MPTAEMLLSIPAMRTAAGEAVAVLRALSNEDRLLLLCQLSQGERSVSELEALLDIRQPTLSQQLSVLRAEGLVTTRREGKYIYYAVADQNVLAILAMLYQLYCPQPKTTRSKKS
ncbi:MAG: metalloregulator ArsR/SmtB family transcription factor [Rugosibacter sp.]